MCYYIDMKKFYLGLIIASLFIFLMINITGCATGNSVKAEKGNTGDAPVDISGPAFDDWRYKGFGKEIPLWFFYAYEGDVAGVVNSRDDLTDADIANLQICSGDALNADQAEKLILQFLETHECGCVDTFWAKICDDTKYEGNPYYWVVLAIY